jgi:hypothetical protein
VYDAVISRVAFLCRREFAVRALKQIQAQQFENGPSLISGIAGFDGFHLLFCSGSI